MGTLKEALTELNCLQWRVRALLSGWDKIFCTKCVTWFLRVSSKTVHGYCVTLSRLQLRSDLIDGFWNSYRKSCQLQRFDIR